MLGLEAIHHCFQVVSRTCCFPILRSHPSSGVLGAGGHHRESFVSSSASASEWVVVDSSSEDGFCTVSSTASSEVTFCVESLLKL